MLAIRIFLHILLFLSDEHVGKVANTENNYTSNEINMLTTNMTINDRQDNTAGLINLRI